MSDCGVVLFHTTSAALRAEKTLLASQLSVRLIPTPRELSSDCGMALRFPWGTAAQVRSLLETARVDFVDICPL